MAYSGASRPPGRRGRNTGGRELRRLGASPGRASIAGASLRGMMMFTALGLALFGTAMIYSATVYEFEASYLIRSCGYVALGLFAFHMARSTPQRSWRRLAPIFYMASLAALAAVFVPGLGIASGGARRWLDLGIFSLQPAEIAKFAAVLVVGCAVSRMRPGSGIPWRALMAMVPLVGLILLQPDFDTTLIILAGVVGVLLASEVRTRDLLLTGAGATVVLGGLLLAEPYRRERVLSYAGSVFEPGAAGYQVQQAAAAIGAGGLVGSGPGGAIRSHYVPEVSTDMIFALVGESFGVLGMLAVIAALMFLVLCALRIAISSPTLLGRCVAAGLAATLAAQITLNLGATMGILPLAGLPLPFISYGGTSLVINFFFVGVLYRLAEDAERLGEAKPGRKPEDVRVPEPAPQRRSAVG